MIMCMEHLKTVRLPSGPDNIVKRCYKTCYKSIDLLVGALASLASFAFRCSRSKSFSPPKHNALAVPAAVKKAQQFALWEACRAHPGYARAAFQAPQASPTPSAPRPIARSQLFRRSCGRGGNGAYAAARSARGPFSTATSCQ